MFYALNMFVIYDEVETTHFIQAFETNDDENIYKKLTKYFQNNPEKTPGEFLYNLFNYFTHGFADTSSDLASEILIYAREGNYSGTDITAFMSRLIKKQSIDTLNDLLWNEYNDKDGFIFNLEIEAMKDPIRV